MSLIDGRDCTIILGPATYDQVLPGTGATLNLCNISAGAELNDEPTIKTIDVYCSDYAIQRRISSKYSIKLKAFVDLTRGRVTSVAVTNGGSGYTSVPTVSFTGGGGTGAAAIAILNGGVVIGVLITNNGTGYTSAPTVSFTGGGGTGAAATAAINQLSSVQFVSMLKTYDFLSWTFYPLGNATGNQGFAGTIARPKIGMKFGEADFCMIDLEGQGSGDYTQVTAP
jgi:hypothetical protein